MGKFSTLIITSSIPEWKTNYINYQQLSQFIKDETNKDIYRPSVDSLEQNSNEIKSSSEKDNLIRNFLSNVDKEFKRMHLFYLNKEFTLYTFVTKRLQTQNNYRNLSIPEIESEYNLLINASEQANNLAKFISLNIKILNKILNKFDKHFEQLKTTVFNDYIVTQFSQPKSELLYLFHYKYIDELCAVLLELKEDLLNAYKVNINNPSIVIADNKDEPLLKNNSNEDIEVHRKHRMISLSAIEIKCSVILSNIETIENIYHELQETHRKWMRMYKLNEYLILTQGKKLSSPIQIDQNMLIAGRNLLSKENKVNVFLTILQKFYMTACSSFIIPNLCNALKDDLGRDIKHVAYYSGLVISFTSIGSVISLIITKAIISKTYKLPMIISCILSIIGNLLYSITIAFESELLKPIPSIMLFCLSRILIGMAMNSRTQRRYLIEFVPRSRTAHYMLLFKLLSLIGNAFGPFVTFFFSFNHINYGDSFRLNSYNVPSYCFTGGAVILLLLVLILYKEPKSVEFEKYEQTRNQVSKVIPPESFDFSASKIGQNNNNNNTNNTNNESNNKILFEKSFANASNVDSKEQDLIQLSISNLLIRERTPGSTITKAFNLVLLNVYVSNFIISSLLVFTPLFMNILNNREDPSTRKDLLEIDRNVCVLIGFTLLSFVFIYFVNFFYISIKIDKRFYILVLSMLLLINEFFLVVRITGSVYFSVLIALALILCYLFEDATIYFYTKMIPADYKVWGVSPNSWVHSVRYLGMFVGSVISLFELFDKDNENDTQSNLNIVVWIQIALLSVTFVYHVVCVDMFKEGPIRRIFRNKNKRKLRRTEF